MLTIPNKKRKILERIDRNLILENEKDTIIIKKISLKELQLWLKLYHLKIWAFKDITEKIRFSNNGNFLLALKLISEFDPFLASYLEKFGNKYNRST